MKGQIFALLAVMFLFLAPQLALAAVNFDQDPSSQDQATFDQFVKAVIGVWGIRI
jgi:hypothetical protein